MIKKITIIGAGNVATHLGKWLFEKGFEINQVYSRNIAHANELANSINSEAVNEINKITATADFYLICIKDDAINTILKKFPFKNKLIAHTSGSVAMNVFTESDFEHYGIFYPLQTFSKDKKVKMEKVPFCIEGNNDITQNTLFQLAQQLSEKVFLINSEQRKILHLAAVFASNFSNYMYTIAHDITNKNNIDFDILKPLIIETAKKIQNNSPAAMQTGPAKRNDEAVMQEHIEMLAENKNYQEIYKLLSEGITKSL